MIDHKIHAILKPTRDYSSFYFNDYSRDVMPAQVERLEEAVAEQNFLDLYPIVTTSERLIIDGHHRFSMARNLMIPFYYTAGNHLTVDDVRFSNELTLSYNQSDAMKSYVNMGVEPYVIVDKLMDRFKKATDSEVGAAVNLLSDSYSRSQFMRGDLIINRQAWAEKVLKCATEIMEYSERRVFNSTYRNALAQIMLTGQYDHSHMLNRIAYRPKLLVRCGQTKHAVAVLEQIYNFNIATHNRIDFQALVNNRKKPPVDEHIVINHALPPHRQIEPRKESIIYKTNDYSIFSSHPSLRPLRDVDNLRNYMQQKNLLEHYPIIVNEKFQIIDGQRRFEAAKSLDCPIYFTVSENFSIWMAIMAGGTRKDWSLGDYAKSYAKQGVPEYIWVEYMQKQYKSVNPSLLIRIHAGGYVDKVRKFRLGQAKFNHAYIENLCKQWLNIESDNRWTNQSLIRAAAGICDYGESMDRLPRLISVINRNWETLKIAMPLAYTSELLLELFNKGLKTTQPARSRSFTPGVGIYRP